MIQTQFTLECSYDGNIHTHDRYDELIDAVESSNVAINSPAIKSITLYDCGRIIFLYENQERS